MVNNLRALTNKAHYAGQMICHKPCDELRRIFHAVGIISYTAHRRIEYLSSTRDPSLRPRNKGLGH